MNIRESTVEEIMTIFGEDEIRYFSFPDYSTPMSSEKAEMVVQNMISLTFEDNGFIGIAVIENCGFGIGRCHFATKKEMRKKGAEAAKAGIDKLFSEHDFDKLIAHVPSFNKKARHFVNSIGFKLYNRREEAYPKDGIYYDMLEYEVLP